MAHKFVVVYAVPIPVGHRITVRWYRQEKSGLFGGKSTLEKAHEPSILDHDTGIEYVSDFAHDGGDGMKAADKPIGISDGPTAGFTVDREITGKVTKCRVVHIRRYSEIDLQTHFEVED